MEIQTNRIKRQEEIYNLKPFLYKIVRLLRQLKIHTKKPAGISGLFLFIRTKGMGEIFHGQTKGYMFACDQLHIDNIPDILYSVQVFDKYFTFPSRF